MKPPLDELYLRHANAVYDPVKAHEYYLRTRQLKGRKPRVGVAVTTKRTKKAVAPPKKTAAQRRKETEAKVVALKNRLEALQKVLAALTKQAKARSGVKSSESTKSNTHDKKQPKKKLTAAQKAEKAKKAKAAYEKNKSPSQQAKELEAKIKTLEKRIAAMRAKLKKSGSVRASKSTAHK